MRGGRKGLQALADRRGRLRVTGRQMGVDQSGGQQRVGQLVRSAGVQLRREDRGRLLRMSDCDQHLRPHQSDLGTVTSGTEQALRLLDRALSEPIGQPGEGFDPGVTAASWPSPPRG